jgi:putative DNA methylase
VLDPFCGGGSIPLEAQRLGLRAYASDLNPVPVLINKALIEIPPKFAGRPPVNPASRPHQPEAPARESDSYQPEAPARDAESYQPEAPARESGSDAATNKPSLARRVGMKKQQALMAREWPGATGLAEDVRYYGKWMRDEAEKRIGHLYPKVNITKEMATDRPDLEDYVGQELTVIASLWTRTVECPNPSCRARMPLVRSFWLSKKKGNECYAKPILDRVAKTVRFEIAKKGEVPKNTTDRNGARCLFCETFIKKPQLREISVAHGVAEMPLAIVGEGRGERLYLPGDTFPPLAIERPDVAFLQQAMTNDKRWFSPPLYGLPNFSDLFTPRQLVALITFSGLVQEARDHINQEARAFGSAVDDRALEDGGSGAKAYADAVATYLAFAVSKASSRNCSLAVWEPGTGFGRLAGALGRQALPMQWTFAETNPLAGAGGDIAGTAESVAKVIDELFVGAAGTVDQLSATVVEQPAMISTDPPYYDNIGYADLSDFFYVWLRRSLGKQYPSLFATVLTPKAQELIASAFRHGGSKVAAQAFFEQGLGKAFSRMQEVHCPDTPLTVYYGFKQAETDAEADDDESGSMAIATVSTGWETMLAGLIRSGFSIHGTWPFRTEAVNALKKDISALASSVVLVCRPRPNDAPLATRKEFITSLRRELPDALRNLQRGSIAPVDLAQAAIGPGMAVFTRYAKVMESDGSPMTVRTALGLINQALDEVLAEQEGEFDGDTRWALAWFEQFGMDEGPFGDAELLSKAKNTAVNGLIEAGIVTARGGKVRLVKRAELDAAWDPATDKRLTVWEITQHLIRTLEQEGEVAAAALVHKLGGMAETARDLAYRLYSLCERKKWADEALAYNGLVIAWPELTKLALAERSRTKDSQQEMF